MKPLVYVAGPYSKPDPVLNAHTAIKAAEEIELYGYDVFIPHLSLLWHLVSPAPYERWCERDNAVLRRCDAVVRLSGHSPGADAECELARSLGIVVVPFSGPGMEALIEHLIAKLEADCAAVPVSGLAEAERL